MYLTVVSSTHVFKLGQFKQGQTISLFWGRFSKDKLLENSPEHKFLVVFLLNCLNKLATDLANNDKLLFTSAQ